MSLRSVVRNNVTLAIVMAIVSAVGSSEAVAQSGKVDCICNGTGQPVFVTMVYIDQVIQVYMEPDQCLEFGVPDEVITVALVAFDPFDPTGTILALGSFETEPQDPPASSCVVFEYLSTKRSKSDRPAAPAKTAIPRFLPVAQ